MAIGVGLGMALAGGATAAGTMIAASQQRRGATRAAELQTQANREAMEFERELEARRRQEWEAAQAENRRQWELSYGGEAARYLADQDRLARQEALSLGRYLSDYARRQPYREMSLAALARLGELEGLRPVAQPVPALIAPPGWEGRMSPPTPEEVRAGNLADLVRAIQQARGVMAPVPSLASRQAPVNAELLTRPPDRFLLPVPHVQMGMASGRG